MFQPLGEGELRAAYLEKGQQAGATKPESSEAIQQPSKSGWGSVVTEGGTEGEEEGEDEFGDDSWEEVELAGAESPDGDGSDGAAMGTDNTGDGGDLEGSDRRAASLGVRLAWMVHRRSGTFLRCGQGRRCQAATTRMTMTKKKAMTTRMTKAMTND